MMASPTHLPETPAVNYAHQTGKSVRKSLCQSGSIRARLATPIVVNDDCKDMRTRHVTLVAASGAVKDASIDSHGQVNNALASPLVTHVRVYPFPPLM